MCSEETKTTKSTGQEGEQIMTDFSRVANVSGERQLPVALVKAGKKNKRDSRRVHKARKLPAGMESEREVIGSRVVTQVEACEWVPVRCRIASSEVRASETGDFDPLRRKNGGLAVPIGWGKTWEEQKKRVRCRFDPSTASAMPEIVRQIYKANSQRERHLW